MATSHEQQRPSGPPPTAKHAASRWQDWLVRLRPLARQTWLNLKVWVPFLLNPADRIRQVTYHARENREGFAWAVRLPRQCWQCGAPGELWHRELEIDLRGFEYPLSVVGAAGGSALFFLLLATLLGSWKLLLLALLSLAIGVGVLLAKSWVETVTIHMATCPAHAAEMPMPGAVTHENELHVFLPNEQLASAARAELRAERVGRDRSLPGVPRGTESDVEPPPAAGADDRFRPYSGPVPRSVELPPIKLADDEEL